MYIGRPQKTGPYIKLDDISNQFNGIDVSFSLTSGGSPFYPDNPYTVTVSLNGVVQEPVSAYTIVGDQITFASPPSAASDFFAVVLGTTVNRELRNATSLATGVDITVGSISADNIISSGIVTAIRFEGDGSQLTGIDATALKDSNGTVRVQANTSGAVVSGVLTTTSLDVSGAVVSGALTATSLDVSGNVSIAGTLTYEDVTNIDAVGLITARSGIHVGTGITYTEDLVVDGDARITGILTIGTGTITIDGNNNSISIGAGGSSVYQVYQEIGLESYTSTHNAPILFTQALNDPTGDGNQATWLQDYVDDVQKIGANATATLTTVATGGHAAFTSQTSDGATLQAAIRTAVGSNAGSSPIANAQFTIVPTDGETYTVGSTSYPVMGKLYVPTGLAASSIDVVVVFHGTVSSGTIQAASETALLQFLNPNTLNIRDKIIFSAAYPQDHISQSDQYNLTGVGTEQADFLMGDNLPYARAAVGWVKNSLNAYIAAQGGSKTINNVYLFGHSQGGKLVSKINTLDTGITGVVANAPGPIQFDQTCSTNPNLYSCSKIAAIYGSGVTLHTVTSSFNKLEVVGVTTLASAGGITTTGGDLYVGNNLSVDGTVTASNYNKADGSPISGSIGIQSAGTVIGTGFTSLNFIGAGNTFLDRGNGNIDISISGSTGGGGGGGGLGTAIAYDDGEISPFSYIDRFRRVTSNLNMTNVNAGASESIIVSVSPNIIVEAGVGVTVGAGKTMIIDVLKIGDL